MNEMVERVARAIADANEEEYEEMKELHDALARAALAAMREPTEAMVKRGSGNIQMVEDYKDAECAAKDAWSAMIDAALADHE